MYSRKKSKRESERWRARVREKWEVEKMEKKRPEKRREIGQKGDECVPASSEPRQAGGPSQVNPLCPRFPELMPCFRLPAAIHGPRVAGYLQCTTEGPAPGVLLM